jgi:hypothetical protein
MALVPNENSPAQDAYHARTSDRDQGAYPRRPIRGVACEIWSVPSLRIPPRISGPSFPGVVGLSTANLRRIAQFCERKTRIVDRVNNAG